MTPTGGQTCDVQYASSTGILLEFSFQLNLHSFSAGEINQVLESIPCDTGPVSVVPLAMLQLSVVISQN